MYYYTDRSVQRQIVRLKLNMRVIKPSMDKALLAHKRDRSIQMKKKNRRIKKIIQNNVR